MTPPTQRSLLRRLPGAYARRMARWFGRRPFALPASGPLITFTFDDFPRSALTAGGSRLEESDARGTYFVALALAGTTIETGEMFVPEDLHSVVTRGHELACHTFDHCPAWETSSAEYERSVERNRTAFTALSAQVPPLTHSYPISYPRPATKRRLARRFVGSRAGGQALNCGVVDLNHLSSFFLEQSRDDFGAVERLIAANAARRGWLIFSTHDVVASPTRFGCTPEFFARTIAASVASGAKLVTMAEALTLLGASRSAVAVAYP